MICVNMMMVVIMVLRCCPHSVIPFLLVRSMEIIAQKFVLGNLLAI